MPATRSILSVLRMMLEAGLPHKEILQTLEACERSLPPELRNPVDNAPVIGRLVDNGDADPDFEAARAVIRAAGL